MAETVQKQNLDLDNMENFETGKVSFAFFDHFSKFSGLAVEWWVILILGKGKHNIDNVWSNRHATQPRR